MSKWLKSNNNYKQAKSKHISSYLILYYCAVYMLENSQFLWCLKLELKTTKKLKTSITLSSNNEKDNQFKEVNYHDLILRQTNDVNKFIEINEVLKVWKSRIKYICIPVFNIYVYSLLYAALYWRRSLIDLIVLFQTSSG